jgi:hypothetical protein
MEIERMANNIMVRGVHEQLGPVGEGWGIEQNPWELAKFLVEVIPVNNFLEIGTGYRGGLARFLASLDIEVTTVDIREYDTQTRDSRVRYIVAEDLWEPDMIFDVVLIDSDHEYYSTKRQWEYYGSFANRVALHDIAGLRACEGVKRLWEAIARTPKRKQLRKRFHEIIDDSPQRAGIGWMEWPSP